MIGMIISIILGGLITLFILFMWIINTDKKDNEE